MATGNDSLVISGAIELMGGGVASTNPRCFGAKFRLGQGYSLGASQPTTDFVASLLLDGERPFGRRSSNRTITLPIVIVAPSRAVLAGAREVLEAAVDQDVWTLTWTQDPVGGTPLPLVFDCFRAQPTALTYNTRLEDQLFIGQLTVTFQALPYGRSDAQTQVSFASPVPSTPPPPPAPVVLDDYTTINSFQGSQSTKCVVGPKSFWWDPGVSPANDPQGSNTSLVYGAAFPSGPLNLSQMTSLGFWFGLGSRYYYNLEHRGRSTLSFYFTLTDSNGFTLAFSREGVRVPASTDPTNPAFTRVVAAIPQGSATFNYASVVSYSLTVVNRARPNRLSWSTAYLDALTAYPSSQTVNTVTRGAVYTLFGVAGTARAPVSLQFTQPPGAGTVTTVTATGSGSYTVPALTSWLKVETIGGGGAGGSRSTSGEGGGGGGAAYAREEIFACAPAQVIPYRVGLGGIPYGIVRGNKSTQGNATSTTPATSWGTAPTIGQSVIVVIQAGTTAPTQVVDNGSVVSAFTLDKSLAITSQGVYIYRANGVTPAAGTYTVTATFGVSTKTVIQGVAYTGVLAGAPTATNSSGPTTGTAVASGSATPAASGALAIAAFVDATALTTETISAAGGGFTNQFTFVNGSTGYGSAMADQINPAGPSAMAASWTLGDSVQWGGIIAVYDCAAPADGGQTTFGPGPSGPTVVSANGGKSAALNSITGALGGTTGLNSVTFPGGAGRTATGSVGGGGGSSAGSASAGNMPVGTTPTLITAVGSSTWPCPPGVTSVLVECWGAGASGATANGNNGQGGGGGEYVAATVAVTPGNNYSYTVGAGGAAVTGSNKSGNDGASTTFTADNGTITAHGGGKGNPSLSGDAPNNGGDGGGFSGGSSTEHEGGDGGAALPYSGSGGSSAGTAADGNTGSGNGTATPPPSGGGAGGAGSGNSAGNGTAGTQPGGGGGGTYDPATSGAGAAGQIRISAGGGFPSNAGGVAVTGGGAGGAGGGSNNTPGSNGSQPGGGGGGGDSTGTPESGGFGGAGQITITPYTPGAFKTLIAHRPPLGSPKMFWPLVGVGNGADTPNGATQYTMPQPVSGVNARFGGTYSVYLINSSWNLPANSRTITVTVTQNEYASGATYTTSCAVTLIPNTQVVNGIVCAGVLTLPVRLIPPDNSQAFFTVSVTDSNTSDRFLDCIFLDTQGQTMIVNEAAGYLTYYVDEPDPNLDMPRFLGAQSLGRPAAVSVSDVLTWSGGPFSIEPSEADNLLFAYCADAAAPNISASYFPRWYFGRLS
ncbi:MAG TPA: hypothetical protein VGI66_03585 [Streptosporangiaceae bacterium]